MAGINPITPVAASIQPPQGMSLGDMVNLARGAQAYQQAEQLNPLALQKAQIEIEQAQKINPLAVRKGTAEAETAEIGTQKSKFDLEKNYAEKARGVFGGYANDPDFISGNGAAIIKKLEAGQAFLKSIGVPSHPNGTTAQLIEMAKTDPKAVRQSINNMIQGEMGAANQQALQTPQLTTNAAGQLVVAQPMQNKIGVLGENDQPVIPQGVTPQSMTRPQGAPMSANPSQAQVGLLNKATDTAAADWANTVADANTSQGRIAIYQNIKSLTPDAFTGVGGERKKFISGLAQSVGIPAYELETSTTDELTKNAKLLSLAGGNTDAARSIAEMATPNAKMTKEAINRVSNQLIGVEKLKQAKADFLAPYLTNPAQYQQKLNEFQNFSDFRLFQEMSPEEVAALKRSMSPAAQKEMSNKIQKARQLGIIQ